MVDGEVGAGPRAVGLPELAAAAPLLRQLVDQQQSLGAQQRVDLLRAGSLRSGWLRVQSRVAASTCSYPGSNSASSETAPAILKTKDHCRHSCRLLAATSIGASLADLRMLNRGRCQLPARHYLSGCRKQSG